MNPKNRKFFERASQRDGITQEEFAEKIRCI